MNRVVTGAPPLPLPELDRCYLSGEFSAMFAYDEEIKEEEKMKEESKKAE